MSRHLLSRAVPVALLAALLGGSRAPLDVAPDAARATASSTAAERAAPLEPPARICGSKQLAGPATRPSGAVAVSSSQRLDTLVDSSAAGTTFWLESGVHLLGPGRYDQVVPKTDMRFIGAPGAVLDGQRHNFIAFGGKATGVRIEHLTIRRFGPRYSNNNEGVVNHDMAHGWRVRFDTVENNAGAGVFVASDNVIADNCLRDNGQYGFSAYEVDGVTDVVLQHNEITGNNADNWEVRREGCGCTGGGKFWDTRGAQILDNWVHDNHGPGLWADTNNTDFLVRGNYISSNDREGLIYETSYNAAIIDNTFERNGVKAGPTVPSFPMAALYVSESGSDPRAGTRYGTTFDVSRNRFINNWSGVMAWENADRFAASPANPTSGITTLVNPTVATPQACGNPALIGTHPYIDDCRWKTQNLRVHDNVFRLDPQAIGSSCTPENACGYSGLVSQYGTFPDWSPYKGHVVEKNITFHQDNVWYSNRYVGPWHFQAGELNHVVSPQVWRTAPYSQDRSSTGLEGVGPAAHRVAQRPASRSGSGASPRPRASR